MSSTASPTNLRELRRALRRIANWQFTAAANLARLGATTAEFEALTQIAVRMRSRALDTHLRPAG